MSFTSLSLTNLASGETGFVAYDITSGFKLLKEVTHDNVQVFQDITSSTAGNGLSSVATTVTSTRQLVRDLSSTGSGDAAGNFGSLEGKEGSLLFINSQAVRLLSYINNSLIMIDRTFGNQKIIDSYTVASPAVFTTTTAHGYSVDDPISFSYKGSMPTGITERTRYYIGTTPSTTTFTISSTTSNGSPVAITEEGTGTLVIQEVYTLEQPSFLPNAQTQTVIGKVTNTSGTYTLDPYYTIGSQNDYPVIIVSSLPASGDYEGQTVLLTTDSRLYIWTGSAWEEAVGQSVTTVNAYLRASSAPSTPTGGSYNFDTLTLTPPAGWSASVPSGTNPLYVSSAAATVQGTSGTDTSLTWTTPAILAQDGSAGTDAKAIKLTASQYAVLYDGAGTKTAVAITLTGTATNFTSPQYRFLENGVERQAWSTTSTYTIPDAQEPAANTADSWTVEVREGSSGTYEAFDTVSIYGVQDGTDGAPGNDGADAYTVVLTNEAHTLSTTNTGTVTYTGSGTSIVVYKGTTELNSVSGTPTTGQFSVSASGSNITPGSITVTGNPAVVADHSSMTADLASVTYTINIENTTTITKVQSLSKSIEGADGDPGSAGVDAKAIKLTASQYAVLYDGTGSKTAVAILLTGIAINFDSPQYRFLENGVERQAWSTTSTYTIPDAQEPAANTADSWTVEVREGSSGTYDAFDTVSIYGVQDGTDGAPGNDGADAYTVVLTNEAHTLPTTNTGTVTYTGSGTSIIVYKGSTELNSVSGTPTTGQFSVSAAGSSITPGSITVTGNPAVVANHNNMTADLASVTYTINIENTTTITKVQSLSKSIEGADGDPGSPGDDGKQVASGQVYYQLSSASAPSTPSATSYTFATGAFSGLTTNWSTSPPTFEAGNSNKYWFSTFTVEETTAGGGTGTPSFTASSQGFGFSGLVTFSGTELTDGTSTYNPASVINNNVTTVNGGKITTNSITANTLTLGNTTGNDRMKLYDDGIDIYNGGVLRVRIGNLSPTGRS